MFSTKNKCPDSLQVGCFISFHLSLYTFPSCKKNKQKKPFGECLASGDLQSLHNRINCGSIAMLL